MEFAGTMQILTYLSWLFAGISAVIAFFPFIYIWQIIQEVLLVSPNFSEAGDLTQKGWRAFLFALLSMLVYVAALMCSHIAAFRVASNIRVRLSHHILTLPLNFVDDFGSGKLRKIVNESSAATETYLAHNLPDQVVAYTTFVGLIFFLLYFNWLLGLVSLFTILLAFICMSSMSGRKVEQDLKTYNDALADMSNEAVEYVRGITVVKTFGQTVFSLKKFTNSINHYQEYVLKYTKRFCAPMVVYTTLINGVFASLILAGLFLTRNGTTTDFTLNFIFYLILTPLISGVLSKIMYMGQNKLIVGDAIKRIDSVLSKQSLEESSSGAIPQNYSIEMKNVTYHYNAQTTAVKSLSLSIKSGQKVAMVGESGSGKSTVANLMARFFDPQDGEILIGGINVKEIRKEDLMNIVSFVFQRNMLMKTTLKENILMGKPDASDDEIMNALTAAQCTDIIQKLPHGIETEVGSDGVYLSGGEIQRVIIARAILKNAPILIMDEATAYADADNEVRIQRALNELSKGKTVVMIAHRLSTIAHVDTIFVLQRGRSVCESGTPTELQKQNGVFNKMWQEYETSLSWKI